MRISFSQYSKFNTCPEWYRLSYINPIPASELTSLYDMYFTALGTYIQRLFENTITLGAYNYKTLEISDAYKNQIKEELKKVIDIETISALKTPEEFDAYASLLKDLESDIDNKIISPTGKVFSLMHKGPGDISKLDYVRDQLLGDAFGLFIYNWDYLFRGKNSLNNTLGITPRYCNVEVEVNKKVADNIDFIGFVDFLFWNDEGHIILDGKLNKNLFSAMPDQLEFYGWALDLDSENTKVGFINYSQQRSKVWDSPDFYNVPKKLKNFIHELENQESEVEWQKRPYSRSEVKGHCKYCMIQDNCSATQPRHKESDLNQSFTDFNVEDFV